MPPEKRKPSGDVSKNYDSIERVQDKARREGKRPSQVCPGDHSGIRGRECGLCGTYFRGDDMG